jgi:hypothetical protein
MLLRILKASFLGAVKEYIQIKREKEYKKLHKLWVEKWNNDLEWINEQIKIDNKHFEWAQLVQQEINMWARIGDKFTMEKIDYLVKMRRFNQIQKQYLIDHALNMGLLISEEEKQRIRKEKYPKLQLLEKHKAEDIDGQN